MELRGTTALIVIDMQRGFDDPSWAPGNNPACAKNVATLLEAWSAAQAPTIVVRHDSVHADSPLAVGSPGNALIDSVADAAPDLFVTKTVNSAFHGEPDLHAWLSARGIRDVVLCGIQTNMCVETTARVGGNLGYDVTVALDATRTFDLIGANGDSMSADDLTRATAINLSGGGFARVCSTAEILA